MMRTQQNMDRTEKWDGPVKEEQFGASRVVSLKETDAVSDCKWKAEGKEPIEGRISGPEKRGRPERREPLRAYKNSEWSWPLEFLLCPQQEQFVKLQFGVFVL